MNSYVYFDCCFFEFCNLTCSYCRTSNQNYARDIALERVQSVVERFLASSRAAIFKVSGYGEAALWEHLLEFMPGQASSFPTLQVMTNGTMKDAVYDALRRIPNLVFCTTLDGFSPEANSHRTNAKPRLHEKMLAFARRVALVDDRPLEINCVIHQRSAREFASFARYVHSELGARAMLMPFPVRPFAGLSELVGPVAADSARRVWDEVQSAHADCSAVLPPLAYLERVFAMPTHANRPWSCAVPAFNYAVGPDLEPRACACLGHTKPSSDTGNRWSAGGAEAYSRDDLARINQARKGFVDARCSNCLTHYDVVNLFLEGRISWEELRRVPSFSLPGVEAIVTDVFRLLSGHVAAGQPPPRSLPLIATAGAS